MNKNASQNNIHTNIPRRSFRPTRMQRHFWSCVTVFSTGLSTTGISTTGVVVDSGVTNGAKPVTVSGVSRRWPAKGFGRSLTPGRFQESPYTVCLPMTVSLKRIRQINNGIWIVEFNRYLPVRNTLEASVVPICAQFSLNHRHWDEGIGFPGLAGYQRLYRLQMARGGPPDQPFVFILDVTFYFIAGSAIVTQRAIFNNLIDKSKL